MGGWKGGRGGGGARGGGREVGKEGGKKGLEEGKGGGARENVRRLLQAHFIQGIARWSCSRRSIYVLREALVTDEVVWPERIGRIIAPNI